MTTPDDPPAALLRLPLGESARARDLDTTIDESMIRVMVHTFYDAVQEDALLGPVFNHHVTDWSVHLTKMCAFWPSVTLHTARYIGRPLEAHQSLPGLSQEHFDRWLYLWTQTVARVMPQASQGAFVLPAQRMATSMSSVLLRRGTPG